MSLGQLAWHIDSLFRRVMAMLDAAKFDVYNARPASAVPAMYGTSADEPGA